MGNANNDRLLTPEDPNRRATNPLDDVIIGQRTDIGVNIGRHVYSTPETLPQQTLIAGPLSSLSPQDSPIGYHVHSST